MPVLGEQPAVGPDVRDGAPYGAGHLVGQVVGAQPARHVGDVDPPAVEALAQPVRHDRVRALVQPPGQLDAAVVELRQGRDVEPRGVGVVVVEPVEAALGARRVGARELEPVVVVAGVVGGQVADHPDPHGVGRVEQPAQGRVPAEQRVDALEGDGVVAVVGPRLEDGSQVEQRGSEVPEVAEPLGDAVERAAVQLERHVGAPVHHGVVPGGRFGPRRHGRAGLGALEPVGKDLVPDLVGHPVGQLVVGADPEVRGVGDVTIVDAGRVEPAEARAAVGEQEPVRRQRVVHVEVGRPPRARLVGALLLGLDDAGLAVADRAEHDVVGRRSAVGRVGHPYPERDARSEHGWLGSVQRGPVVVRVPPWNCGAHPLTPPEVMPPTMNLWRKRNSRITGMAMSSTPAAKTPRLLERSPSMSP